MACVRVYAQPLDLKLDQPRVSSWLLYYRQYYYHHHHFLYHSQIFPLQPFPSYLGQNTYYCNKLMSMIKSFSCTEMTLRTTSLIWKRSICGRKFVTNCLQRGKKGMNRTPHPETCLPLFTWRCAHGVQIPRWRGPSPGSTLISSTVEMKLLHPLITWVFREKISLSLTREDTGPSSVTFICGLGRRFC